MRNLKLFSQALVLMSGLFFFAGCQQDEALNPADLDERTTTLTAYPNVTFYGLGLANELYTYRSGPPATLVSRIQITGLRDGEQLLAIDFSAANGKLYAVSNMDLIYTINLTDFGSTPAGSVTRVSQAPFTPSLEGTTVAMDINPRTNQIHLITDKGQNLRLSTTTGQVVGVDISPSTGGFTTAINSAAFSNSSSTTVGSTLYDMDALEGKLYRQAASSGSLTLVGSSGLTITGEGGMDISRTGAAFAVYNASGPRPQFSSTPTSYDDTTVPAYRLYGISLRNGAATSLGQVKPMIGIAIR